MKEITNYIIEKFRINKNIKLKKFYNGDNICILSLHLMNSWTDELEVEIYPPYKLTSIDEEENRIEYSVEVSTPGWNSNQPKTTKKIDLYKEYYINSHGFHQEKDEDKRTRTLYLCWSDMQEFLKLLLKEKVFNPNYDKLNIIKILKDKYFDDIKPLKPNNKKIILMDFSGEHSKKHFERPKDLKEFINKFYTIDN